jgi:hypothetical protein
MSFSCFVAPLVVARQRIAEVLSFTLKQEAHPIAILDLADHPLSKAHPRIQKRISTAVPRGYNAQAV